MSDGDAAVVRRVRLLGDQLLVELRRVGPDRPAGRAVQRVDATVGARIVQHAIKGQRRRLNAAGGALRKMHPGDFEILDVTGIDLVEAAVMVGLIGAVMRRPVVLGRLGIQGSVCRLRRRLSARRRDSDQGSHRQRGAADKISFMETHLYPSLWCLFVGPNFRRDPCRMFWLQSLIGSGVRDRSHGPAGLPS